MNKSPNSIELYSVYINTVISNENRRQKASVIYLSLISAGLGFGQSLAFFQYVELLRCMIIPVSFIWLITIIYFRALAQAKFKVIIEMEKEWEIKPFGLEWKHLKDKKIIALFPVELTFLEMCIPIITLVYSILYILFDFNS